LKIISSKAFSDFKDSSTSSDSETKLFQRKLDSKEEDSKRERKISKFKPPVRTMEDEKHEEIINEIDQIKLQQSFQSQKDFTRDQDEEHEKKLKRKEKKLKETYYLIKLYMIIQKTSTIFLKNSIDISEFFI